MECIFLSKLPYLWDFCFQSQRTSLEQHGLGHVRLVQYHLSNTTAASLIYAFACFCEVVSNADTLRHWSRKNGEGAVPVGWPFLSDSRLFAHMGGDHIICFPPQDTFESALFNYARTAGVNFNCPVKTRMCAHPCHVAVWAPKFARSVDFSRRTKTLIFYVKSPRFKWLLFLKNTTWTKLAVPVYKLNFRIHN